MSNARIHDALRKHPLWSEANPATLMRMADAARLIEVRPGQVTAREGELAREVHLLVEGHLRVYYAGTRLRPSLTVRLFSAPAVYGDSPSLENRPFPGTIEALTDAVVVAVLAREYLAALTAEPRCLLANYRDMARRFASTVKQERASAGASVDERTVALLFAYAQQFGVSRPDGTLIDRMIPQEELAEQTGSNRRSIVRTMERLYASGALARRGRRLLIVDRERLLGAVKGEVAPLVHSTAAPESSLAMAV